MESNSIYCKRYSVPDQNICVDIGKTIWESNSTDIELKEIFSDISRIISAIEDNEKILNVSAQNAGFISSSDKNNIHFQLNELQQELISLYGKSGELAVKLGIRSDLWKDISAEYYSIAQKNRRKKLVFTSVLWGLGIGCAVLAFYFSRTWSSY